jgi:hypothetical protein
MNAKGFVLMVTIFVLLLLTLVGIAATRTSIVELQISGNHKTMVQDFYASEGALIDALEHTEWWLNDEFLKNYTGMAGWTRNVDVDGDGVDDALVEIRCVEPTSSRISPLSVEANDIPSDRHIAPPPIGSGYSARHFCTRKYAVTATGLRSNTKLQSGAWKVFNKY